MASKAKVGQQTPLRMGPFNGVNATLNPVDDTPNLLTDALNGYFPDPINGSEFASRPAFLSSGAPTTNMTNAADIVQILSGGTRYLFAMMTDGGGTTRLYRGSSPVNPTWTDVSPVGITMSAGVTTLFPFNGQLIVTDSVNQPWVGTNLSATPITGTLIHIDTANDPWVAIGSPTLYVDSIVFICATTVSNAVGGLCIVWCEPNQPLVGYMQSGFADFWNLIQTGTDPLFCIKGTNSGLFFARQNSWGILNGVPSESFATTASQDTVSYNIGCVAAKTVQTFGNYLYFLDSLGRPYRMAISGGAPEPIWLRMREFIDAVLVAGINPTLIQQSAWAVIEPQFNKYVFFAYPVPANATANASVGHVFDAQNGNYEGRWQIQDWANSGLPGVSTGASMFCGCVVQNDATKLQALATLGNIAIGLTNGHIGTYWVMQSLFANAWEDGIAAAPNPILVQSPRLGYSAQSQLSLGVTRAVTNNQTPVNLTVIGTNGTVGPYPSTPPASSDNTNLAQWASVGTQGRGFLLQFAPTTSTSQWRLFLAECEVTAENVQMSDA